MKTHTVLVFVFIFSLVLVFSCLDNDVQYIQQPIAVERIKIDSVQMASSMLLGQTAVIKTFSTYNNGCHKFYGYRVDRQGYTRKVTAFSYYTAGPCTQATYVGASTINFRPVSPGTYIFKFYQSIDPNTNDTIYLSDTIQVN